MFERLLAKEGIRVSALLTPDGRLVGAVTNIGDRTVVDGLLEILLSPSPEKAASPEEYRASIQTLFVSFPEAIPPGTTRRFETGVPRPDGDRPWDCYDFMFYS
jgi:hypothetical protein